MAFYQSEPNFCYVDGIFLIFLLGLNTIREICLRSPLVMEGHEALLKDLLQYRKFKVFLLCIWLNFVFNVLLKDKGVMMAARSLLQLFRALNPSLLPRKMRVL